MNQFERTLTLNIHPLCKMSLSSELFVEVCHSLYDARLIDLHKTIQDLKQIKCKLSNGHPYYTIKVTSNEVGSEITSICSDAPRDRDLLTGFLEEVKKGNEGDVRILGRRIEYKRGQISIHCPDNDGYIIVKVPLETILPVLEQLLDDLSARLMERN